MTLDCRCLHSEISSNLRGVQDINHECPRRSYSYNNVVFTTELLSLNHVSYTYYITKFKYEPSAALTFL